MKKPIDIRLARALHVRKLHEERQARDAAIRQAAANLPEPDREMHLPDAFKQAFAARPSSPPPPREYGQPSQHPWDAVIAALGDDDTPRPPDGPAPAAAAASQPAPAPLPPEETRARQVELSADSLFEAMAARLQPGPREAVTLPPAQQLRRALRELPDAQRQALAATVEAQDYGIVGYFDSSGFGPDYRAVLVSSALARRYQDAQRLQPELSPTEMLQQMLDPAN